MEIEQFLPELGQPGQLCQAIYCIILSSLHYHMGFELSFTKIMWLSLCHSATKYIHTVTALSHMTLLYTTVQIRMQYPNVKFSVIIRHRIIWNIKMI